VELTRKERYMKKIITMLIVLFTVTPVYADWIYPCGDIERMRTWANGNDTYGIWIEYKNNPSSCSGGFYVRHAATNKNLVFSMVLAAKTAGQRICIQTNPLYNMIGSRCLVNYVYHE